MVTLTDEGMPNGGVKVIFEVPFDSCSGIRPHADMFLLCEALGWNPVLFSKGETSFVCVVGLPVGEYAFIYYQVYAPGELSYFNEPGLPTVDNTYGGQNSVITVD